MVRLLFCLRKGVFFMTKKTCENCKYAIISFWWRLCSDFGGRYTPDVVDDCSCPELPDEDDLETILENGELGNCKYWKED